MTNELKISYHSPVFHLFFFLKYEISLLIRSELTIDLSNERHDTKTLKNQA